MREILQDTAPLLGVILPAIAAFFMYRSAERKKQAENEQAAKAVPVAIGGALASVEGAKLHVEQMQRVGASLDKLADAFNRVADGMHEEARWRREVFDELNKTRRAMEDIAQRMGQRSTR